MWFMLAVVGAVLGIAAAYALYSFFRQFRPPPPLTIVVIGWLVAVPSAFFAVLLFLTFLGSDLSESLMPFWLALSFCIPLLLDSALGLLHKYQFQMSWAKAFGVLIGETMVAVVFGLMANGCKYPLAEILRGGSQDIPAFLASHNQANYLIGYFDLALILSLLLLEGISPFIRRRHMVLPIIDPDTVL